MDRWLIWLLVLLKGGEDGARLSLCCCAKIASSRSIGCTTGKRTRMCTSSLSMHTVIKRAVDLTRITQCYVAVPRRGGASSLAEENLETWFSLLCEGLLGLASAQIYMQKDVQENSRKVLKTKSLKRPPYFQVCADHSESVY